MPDKKRIGGIIFGYCPHAFAVNAAAPNPAWMGGGINAAGFREDKG
jgi:hypothetical protein